MQVRHIQLEKLEHASGSELSEECWRVCAFCDKLVRLGANNSQSCRNLGGKQFYCPFCLRNNFHLRSNRNVLMMSYRGLIGTLYYDCYDCENRSLWASDLERMIKEHALIGLQSPVFSYDPATFMWFLDFNRIGSDTHKAPVSDVLETASRMLAVFKLDSFYNGNGIEEDVWDRFDKAITLFYAQRKRPKDRRQLIPTLDGICEDTGEEYVKKVRPFVRSSLRYK